MRDRDGARSQYEISGTIVVIVIVVAVIVITSKTELSLCCIEISN